MPYKPIDYSKCCIYKIEHVNNDKLIYIGSTTNFKKRKSAHKYGCYNEKHNQYNYKVYKTIRENGGWKMFKMIEIEKYPCKDRQEAERREHEIMKEYNPSMNTHLYNYKNSGVFVNLEKIKKYKKIYDECMFELLDL